MALVVCMAGKNTRFHDVGFDIPKYLLPWNKTTIIGQILSEIIASGYRDQILLLVNKRDQYFMPDLIEATLSFVEPKNIHYIDDTQGQAHTALIGASLVQHRNVPFYIHNGDTIITKRNFHDMTSQLLNRFDAFVDVFVSNSPAYSYVQENDGLVTDIVEKNAISPFASSGLYGFKNAEQYAVMTNQITKSSNEMYVSNVLKYMLTLDKSISINGLISGQETIVLGTPQEYGLEFAKQAYRNR